MNTQTVTTEGNIQSAGNGADVLNVVLGMGSIVLITIGFIIPWILALVQVIRRNDLKESRLLWIILLVVVGPLGVILYAFMEGRKTLGYIALALYIGIPLLLVVALLA